MLIAKADQHDIILPTHCLIRVSPASNWPTCGRPIGVLRGFRPEMRLRSLIDWIDPDGAVAHHDVGA